MRCGHIVHGACLIQWLLAKQHDSHLCPTCRQDVELQGLTNYRILNAQSAPMSEMVILANTRDVCGERYDRD
eukprot:1668052-Lingulodinium_polyedra.AAC.1